MKNKLLIFTMLSFFSLFAQNKAYKSGEWLKFRLSYSGFFKAGDVELKLTEKNLNGKKVLHAQGKGKTSGVVNWVFKVDDRYESYFDTDKVTPYKFIRDVDEGGHKIRRNINFKDNKAHIEDYVTRKRSVKKAINVQDMISSFYYLRNQDISNLKKGDEIKIDMFFDGETFPFKIKFLGNQVLKTKFGKVKTHLFRPLVQSGRVFRAKESVTIWITADENKIPVFIKADLAVGSVRINLVSYKGLANSFRTVVK